MTYPESELYQGIADRLLSTAAAVESHYTNAGHVKPTEIRVYNRDYEDLGETEKRNSGKLPFARPAVFVEFQDYQLEDKGGYLCGPVPIILHIVQDIYVTGRSGNTTKQTAHKDLLKYPTLIQQLVHLHRIDNCILNASPQIHPDHEHKNLLVHKISVTARVKLKTVNIATSPITAYSYTNNNQTADSDSENLVPMEPQITGGSVSHTFELDVIDALPAGVMLNKSTGVITFGEVGIGDHSFDVVLDGVAVARVNITVPGEAVIKEPDQITGDLTFWTKSELTPISEFNAADHQLNNEANAALNAQLLTGGAAERATSNEEIDLFSRVELNSDTDFTAINNYFDNQSKQNLLGEAGLIGQTGWQVRINRYYFFAQHDVSAPIGDSANTAMRKSGTTLTAYKNGVPLADVEEVTTGYPMYTGNLVGRIGGGPQYWHNSNLALFLTALTDAEILDIYNNPSRFIEKCISYGAFLILPYTEAEYYKDGEFLNYGSNGRKPKLNTSAAGNTYKIGEVDKFQGLQTALNSFNVYVSQFEGNLRKQRVLALSPAGITDLAGQPITNPWKPGLLNFSGGLHGGMKTQSPIGNVKTVSFSIKVPYASIDQVIFNLGTPGTIAIVNSQIVAPAFSSINGLSVTDANWLYVECQNATSVNIDETHIIPAGLDCFMVPPVTYATQITEGPDLKAYFETLYN